MADEKPQGCCGPNWGDDKQHEIWHHRRSTFGLFWGLLLIWLGVSFFLQTQGIITPGDWWKYFIIGLGVIFLIESAVRYNQPAHRGLGRGRFVAGLVLISVGVAFLVGFGSWWPLILIVLGLVILFNSWLRRR